MKTNRLMSFITLSLLILTACTPSQSSDISQSESSNESLSLSEEIEREYLDLPQFEEYLELDEEKMSQYKTIYFDAVGGDDVNAGTSINAPKKSLGQVAEIIKKYGTIYPLRILLKRGTQFTGNLVLADYHATEEFPFILDAYGESENLPVIHGVGSDGTIMTNAIIWLQEDNTRIMNLELTGPDCSRGIYVLPRKSGIYKNIVIKNNYLHDINWNWQLETSPDETDPATIDPELVTPAISVNRYRRLYGGIEFFGGTADVASSLNTGPIVFESIFIEENKLEYVSTVAINVYNNWVNRGGVGYGYNKFVPDDPFYQDFERGIGFFPNKNIVVRDNYTNCIGGDGIVVNGSMNVWLINNTSYKSSYLGRSGFFNAGIWLHNTINGYMFYNEAAYTYLVNGAGDGQGFDIDNACENIYFYYNYAHHNQGGGLLLCNNKSSLFIYDKNGELVNTSKVEMVGEWKNNYARNNVFVNNGLASNNRRSGFITTARQVNNFIAENNTIILDNIENQHIINCEDNVVSINHIYRNNIFYTPYQISQPIFANQTLIEPQFVGNLYYNIASGNALENQLILTDDINGTFDVDPEFVLPIDYRGFEKSLDILPGVSLLNYATLLESQLRLDLRGQSTVDVNYMGAIIK